jgi:hypothetical protein
MISGWNSGSRREAPINFLSGSQPAPCYPNQVLLSQDHAVDLTAALSFSDDSACFLTELDGSEC